MEVTICDLVLEDGVLALVHCYVSFVIISSCTRIIVFYVCVLFFYVFSSASCNGPVEGLNNVVVVINDDFCSCFVDSSYFTFVCNATV